MTKEITKANILQEMQDKFKLRDFDPAKFLFNEMVIPTYNIAQHLEHWKIEYSAVTVTGTGNVLFYTVPSNEKWILHRYDVVFVGVNTCTIAGANIRRLDGTPDSVYLDLTAGQTLSYHKDVQVPATLVAGDRLYINFDGFTSNQVVRLYIDYMMEEIR